MDKSAQPIAQVSMQGQGSSEAAPQLTISAANLTFGSVTVNTATTQSLTLTSTGTSSVTVNSVAITGAGFTIIGRCPVTLNPTESTTLQVQFAPTSPGAASGQLAISSNSASGSAAVVTLSGTGTTGASPQTSPLLTISAATLSFGNVTVNTATTQSLTLTSTGTSPVTVNFAADYWDWLYDRRGTFPRDAESYPIDDAAGAVRSNIDWDSNGTTFDQQQFVDREHGDCGLERYEYHRTESSIDDKRCEP